MSLIEMNTYKICRLWGHTPWCVMVIIYMEEESYATVIGKIIKETVKKYH